MLCAFFSTISGSEFYAEVPSVRVKPDTWTDSSWKLLRWKSTNTALTVKMAWTFANPGTPLCTHLKKSDSHVKHNSLISTISWLPFPLPTQRRFSHTYVLLSLDLRVFALHSLFLYSDIPCPILFAQAIFELKLFPYKYPNNIIAIILPA